MQEKVEVKMQEIFDNVNKWLTHAEAKNAGILALNGGLILGLLVLILSDSYTGSKIVTTYLNFTILSLLFSLLFALVAFLPITLEFQDSLEVEQRDVNKVNLMFFGDIATFNSSRQFVCLLYKGYFNEDKSINEITKMEIDYACEIIINSKITMRKYRMFKYALFCFLSAVLTPFLTVLFLIFSSIWKKLINI